MDKLCTNQGLIVEIVTETEGVSGFSWLVSFLLSV